MADRLGRWTADDVPDQSGRTAVVTGASGGLGLETAEVLARRGASVVLACRDLGRAEGAAERIRQHSGNADVRVVHLDLASLASVRAAAGEIRDGCPSLDLLINNAGVMNIPRELTEDGFERTLGTNHFGHFALTGLLLGGLTGTPGSRVVTVSSNGHREGDGVMHFEDLQLERGYKPWPAYYRSKLANLLFTYELQRRFAVTGACRAPWPRIPATPAPTCGGTRAWTRPCTSPACGCSRSGSRRARVWAPWPHCGRPPTRQPRAASITARPGGTSSPATRSGSSRAPSRTTKRTPPGCGRSPRS